MTTTHSPVSPSPGGASQWRWPLIIIGLLAFQAIFAGVMLYVATNDKTFAVEPDYYQQAVHWDRQSQQRRDNDRLGWTISVALGEPTPNGGRMLDCALNNVDGTPLDGATISVVAFPHLRGNERRSFDLAARTGGHYQAEQVFDQPGVWELRFTVVRGPETFTALRHVEVAAN